MSPLFSRSRKVQIPGLARDDEGGTTMTAAETTSNVVPAKAGISAATICQAAALVLAYPEAELLDRIGRALKERG